MAAHAIGWMYDERSEPRDAVHHRTRAVHPDGRLLPLLIVNTSQSGFMARCEAACVEGDRLRGGGEWLGTRQSGEMSFRLAPPEQLAELMACAQDDARLLIDRDGGLEGERGQAARVALYLFERDAGVQMLRSG